MRHQHHSRLNLCRRINRKISQKPKLFPFFQQAIARLHGDAVLLVDVDDKLHLVVGAEEDTAAVVDAFGDDGEHARHVAVDCLATSC